MLLAFLGLYVCERSCRCFYYTLKLCGARQHGQAWQKAGLAIEEASIVLLRQHLDMEVEDSVKYEWNARIGGVLCGFKQISIELLSLKRLKREFSDGLRYMKSGTESLPGKT
jgi:hypothetical protein